MSSSDPKAPAGWPESLARSKAQIAAGTSEPLLPILDRIRNAAERLEASDPDVEARRSAGR